MRELLLQRDFDQISTEQILKRAGVSRGALYHHFPSKVDLFKAAWQASERDNIKRILATATEYATGNSPFDQLKAGCRAYLREAARPSELQRIGLRQSRVVLGWEGWREGAKELGIAVMQNAVAAAVQAGELATQDVETTTYLIFAPLIESALLISTDRDPEAALARVEPELLRLLDALRQP
jgi:AcrR family transcriptional regulator